MIRRAVPADAHALAALKRACWPGERADAAYMAHVLAAPDHVILQAEIDGVPAGFVDGFLTLAADGARRWELDLLGVQPEHRRQGLGRALVASCTQAGRDMGAVLARALIRADNIASQHVFRRCGYTAQPGICRLMIAGSASTSHQTTAPPAAHLIPVLTLGYQGVWVEGEMSIQALNAARAVRDRFGWHSAGAVIPLDAPDALVNAATAGYAPAGDYTWWHCDYT